MMNMAATTVPQMSDQFRSRPEDAAQHITVSDPVQHSDGLNKYTSYRVDVRPVSAVPGEIPRDVILSNTTYSAVLRRYSDFLWLFEHLHVERAGAIIPPIPEKQPVGRFSPAFVEDRRAQLERFLRRVAVHPELADASCLDLFLRADDVTFQAAKNAKKGVVVPSSPAMNHSSMTAPSPAKKDGFKRWFAEARTSMTGDLVRSPDDDLFDEINRYIHGLDNQMRNVSLQASGLVRKGKEIANGLFEFGLAFSLLGQSEADALGDALRRMGETADRLSVLSAEHAEKEMAQFEEPLQDYIKMIHCVKLALQRRHEKRLTYSTCVSDVQAKQAQLAKLRMQIGSEAKAYATEMSLRQSHEAAEAARDDFATVSQRILREVDRFKREKAEDMRATVLNYINLQVSYNKQVEDIWATLIPQLERVQLDCNSGDAIPSPSENPPPTQPQQQMIISHQQHQQQQMMQSQYAVPSQTMHPVIHQAHEIPQYYNQVTPPRSSGQFPTPQMGGDPSSMISVQYRDPSSGIH